MGLRVLHVVESLKPEAGSVAISLRGLFRALQQCNVESEVVTLDDAGAGSVDGARVTTFEARCADGLVQGADVVHLHGWGSDLARAVTRLARKHRTPYVVSPHGMLSDQRYQKTTWKERLLSRLGDNKMIKLAGAVAAVNEQEHRDLQERKVSSNVMLLPYGLSFTEYETVGPVEGYPPTGLDGRCLLLLGPIHPIEGWVPLLTAFAEIGADSDGWKVVLAGPRVDDWYMMLEAAVRRKGASDRVLLTSADKVAVQRSWLARASVLAAVSLQVRCPVSLLQAVAAGVPVIASKWGLLGGLENVIRVCTPNRAELKEALRGLFRLSDDERKRLAQEAREVGRRVFDWSALVGRYVQLYESLT